ncbi:hypothetical protein TKK_0018707 [Trichogramma kaykai]|uniref:Uncharacterized protein n=1 Tax=Trichogramma kaykai TaxID=54128 RepID=A0ABD2VXG6_9HYME
MPQSGANNIINESVRIREPSPKSAWSHPSHARRSRPTDCFLHFLPTELNVNASPSQVDIEGDTNGSSKDTTTNPTLWGQTKYCYNRFRYYHYVVADKIDMYLSAVCLWILNLYFRLFWSEDVEGPSVQ